MFLQSREGLGAQNLDGLEAHRAGGGRQLFERDPAIAPLAHGLADPPVPDHSLVLGSEGSGRGSRGGDRGGAGDQGSARQGLCVHRKGLRADSVEEGEEADFHLSAGPGVRSFQ